MLIIDFFDKIMNHNKMFLNTDYPFKPLNKEYQKWEIAERVYTFNHLNLLFDVYINRKTIDKNILISFINATNQFHNSLVEDKNKIKRYKDLLIIEKYYSLEFINWLQEINNKNTKVKKMYDDIIKKYNS